MRAFAGRYGISPTAVQKWRKRESVSDARMGPKAIHSAVLTAEEEAMVAAFRRHTLLPLDTASTLSSRRSRTPAYAGGRL